MRVLIMQLCERVLYRSKIVTQFTQYIPCRSFYAMRIEHIFPISIVKSPKSVRSSLFLLFFLAEITFGMIARTNHGTIQISAISSNVNVYVTHTHREWRYSGAIEQIITITVRVLVTIALLSVKPVVAVKCMQH